MHTQRRAIGAEGIEFGLAQPAFQKEGSIERQRGVALGEDKTVSFQVLRTGNTQHFPEKKPDDVSHGQRGANMAYVGPFGLIQNNPP